ncbi:hypothetical protein B0H16DRAFT_1552857 [Mycena metata]|uniref:Uncharacterized protein n=1 Tax=Mycena metata TaxID=1033252 RepID=A0AAD7N7K6_9AGAR|nr:hypothetical protein B0H16DRAFT_1552857 [Mycena metata]
MGLQVSHSSWSNSPHVKALSTVPSIPPLQVLPQRFKFRTQDLLQAFKPLSKLAKPFLKPSRLSNINSAHPGPTATWSRRSLRECRTQVSPRRSQIDCRSAPPAPHFRRCAADIKSGGLDRCVLLSTALTLTDQWRLNYRSKHRASTAPCALTVSPHLLPLPALPTS